MMNTPLVFLLAVCVVLVVALCRKGGVSARIRIPGADFSLEATERESVKPKTGGGAVL
jgi:hypothetical protein